MFCGWRDDGNFIYLFSYPVLYLRRKVLLHYCFACAHRKWRNERKKKIPHGFNSEELKSSFISGAAHVNSFLLSAINFIIIFPRNVDSKQRKESFLSDINKRLSFISRLVFFFIRNVKLCSAFLLNKKKALST